MNHSSLLGSTKKSKKRLSSPVEQETPQTMRRKVSAKKPAKKPALDNPDSALLGLDAASLYSNSALASLQYEDCMKNTISLQNIGLDFQQIQQHQQHQQQQYHFSMFEQPSPPHSVTFSPPAKSRPSLPTSPTHMAAMRTATQQKHANMHYTDPFNLNPGIQSNPTYQQPSQPPPQPLPQQQQQQQTQYYHFLTPPSEPTERNSYPTPSPESPRSCYWSSSSPHSNSDWSEGMLSPNSSTQGTKPPEAIFI